MKTIRVLPVFIFFLILATDAIKAQIQITSGPAVTPEQMVENIVGPGILYSNVQYIGVDTACGIFTNGSTTDLGFDSGILMTTGRAKDFAGPNTSPSTSTDNGFSFTLPNWDILYDPCILKFDFIPEGDTLKLLYVFGSEEYNEWVGSQFLDVMKIVVTGPNPYGGNYMEKNIAIVPGTTNMSVKVNSINNGYALPGTIPMGPCTNCAYFDDNTNGSTLQYDGKTVTLIAWLLLVPCAQYHIEFWVYEPFDPEYLDSGIAIEANSFRSNRYLEVDALYNPSGIMENMVEGHVSADIVFKLPNTSFSPMNLCFEVLEGPGFAINGIDYEWIDNCVTFEAGEDSAVLYIVPLFDNLIEGDEDVVLVIENTLGCSIKYDTVSFTIKDYWQMVSLISPNTAICPGQEIELMVQVYNGFPPYQYYWEPGGFTDDTIVVSPASTTMYKVTYSDLFNETGEDSVLVTVLPVCDLETFYFEAILNPGLPYNVYGEVMDDTVFVVFPPGTNLNALIPSFTFSNEACTDTVGTINNFTNPVVYQFIGPGGCSTQWVVIAEIETRMGENPNEGIIIIPNPSDGRFIIFSDKLCEIRIMAMTGRVIYEGIQKISGKIKIDLTDQPKGMYFVRVKSGEGLLTLKIVIQ